LRITGCTGGRAARARLAHLEKGDADLVERRRRRFEQRMRAAVVDALHLAVGGKPHGRAVAADRIDHPLRHFAQQPHPVGDRTAIAVVAEIGIVAQELVDQIAVRGVDLHPVEAGTDRIAGRIGIIVEYAGDLVGA